MEEKIQSMQYRDSEVSRVRTFFKSLFPLFAREGMGWAVALHSAILSPVLRREQAGVHFLGVPGAQHWGAVGVGADL